MTGLLEIAERCEKATGPDRELDAAIAAAAGMEVQTVMVMAAKPYEQVCTIHRAEGAAPVSRPVAAYTASLDAAMTLVPEGWDFNLITSCNEGFAVAKIYVEGSVPSKAATLALALCAATLRSRGASKPSMEE